MAFQIGRGKFKCLGILTLFSLLLLLLCSCSAKPSIVGTWRLESGKFSYMSETYDKCAIEFTDIGEYVLYEGKHYENDYYHGSYTYNGNQITMVIDGIFRYSANCSVEGDRLVLVTSSGTASFVKIDTSSPATSFGDYAIRSLYEGKGYQVSHVNLVESTEYTQTYQTTITASYRYMDEEILRQDTCVYSKIGQNWYLSSSEEVDVNENWHINGLWTAGDKKLEIHSFTSESAIIDYYSPMLFQPAYQSSGEVKVYSFTDWEGYETLRIDLPPNHDTIVIDKNSGVQVGVAFYATQLTYQNSKNN